MSILSDKTIRTLIAQNKLVPGGDPSCAKHCAYEFRAARVVYGGIDPTSQQVTDIDLTTNPTTTAVIQPSAVVWVRSHEQVEIPDAMVGIWVQTNSLSRIGLLLLNSTLVEPGYKGYLSAHFVNLGSSPVSLCAGTTIAKLIFATLDESAKVLVDPNQFLNYDRMLNRLAVQSTRSFLRISELVPDLSKAANSLIIEANRAIGDRVKDAENEVKSFANKAADDVSKYAKQTEDDLKKKLSDVTTRTLYKVGGGFLLGFSLAVGFALWIFPKLRDLDSESKNRIADVIAEKNARLSDDMKFAQHELAELRARVDAASAAAAATTNPPQSAKASKKPE